MKKGEYVYTFVPDFITRKWSDDDSLIRIIGQETLSVRTEDYREIFQEGYITEGSSDSLDLWVLFDEKELEDNLLKVEEGDYSLLDTMARDLASLASMLFYANPLSWWRLVRLMAKDGGKFSKIKDDEKRWEYVFKELTTPRDSEALGEVNEMAHFMAPYMYDLKPILLEAQIGSSFVLGCTPLVVMNFFTDPMEEPDVAFFHNGAVLYIPISPQYAVCLYDSFVYKPKKTDGRILLTKDEVFDINRYVAAISSQLIFRPDEKCDEEYYINLVKTATEGDYNKKEFAIPEFRIMSRAYDVEELATRIYPGLLNVYDASKKVVSFDEREEMIEKLLEKNKV